MVRILIAFLLAGACLLAPGTSPAQAYTGQQTYRDDSGPCCWFTSTSSGGSSVWGRNTAWNGFDYDSKWIGAGVWPDFPYFNWVPAPSPSGAVECPVFHVASINLSQAEVTVAYEYHNGGTVWSQNIYESYSWGYWENLPKDKYYTGDFLQMGNTLDEYTMTADVISFHWNSSNNYTSCSF